MFKKLIAAAAVILSVAGAAQAAWPERPITLIVPWATGGGTDAIARMIASGLEKQLGQPVNVVNRVGGSGIVGHTEMINARPDGYTIGFATGELATYYWNNTAPFKSDAFNPIALVNIDPAAVWVSAKSDWKTLPDLIAAIKKAPSGSFKITAPIGAAYHLAVSDLLISQGIDPKSVPLVPSQGAAPGFQELASGGVHLAPFSLPEGKAMLEAGVVRPLATLSNSRHPNYPDVPTVKEAMGVDIAGGTWRSVVGPKALPADISNKLSDAVEKVVNTPEFKTFMTERGFGVAFEKQGAFSKFMANVQAKNGEVMKALGLRLRD
jgi:tripartite-type tricarboxylate transporter receptor subunit TctC